MTHDIERVGVQKTMNKDVVLQCEFGHVTGGRTHRPGQTCGANGTCKGTLRVV